MPSMYWTRKKGALAADYKRTQHSVRMAFDRQVEDRRNAGHPDAKRFTVQVDGTARFPAIAAREMHREAYRARQPFGSYARKE